MEHEKMTIMMTAMRMKTIKAVAAAIAVRDIGKKMSIHVYVLTDRTKPAITMWKEK